MSDTTKIRPRSNPNARRRLAWLSLFILLNCVVLNFTLSAIFHQTSALDYTTAFFQRIAQNDSWMPMHGALLYLRTPELQQSSNNQPLYTAVFFGRHLKFVYPATSLLFVEPFIQVHSGDSTNYVALNTISFVLVLLMTGLLVWLYLRLRNSALDTPAEPASVKYAHIILVVLVSLTFYPLLRAFVLGQIQVWLDALFVAAVLAWTYRRKTLAGVLCGIMAVVKPQIGLLLLWGLIRKERQFTVALAVTALVFIAWSLQQYGIDNNVDYLNVLSYISKHGESYFPNQSVNGFLNRMLFNGNNLEWQEYEYPPFHPAVFWGTIVSSALLVGAALFWKRNESKAAPLLDFLIFSLSITIASPLAWEHHFGIMLPMFLVAVVAAFSMRDTPVSLYVLLACSFVLCSNVFDGTNVFAHTPLNVLQSYLLFGALLLLALLYRFRNIISRGAVPVRL